jgi:hypothetical protein
MLDWKMYESTDRSLFSCTFQCCIKGINIRFNCWKSEVISSRLGTGLACKITWMNSSNSIQEEYIFMARNVSQGCSAIMYFSASKLKASPSLARLNECPEKLKAALHRVPKLSHAHSPNPTSNPNNLMNLTPRTSTSPSPIDSKWPTKMDPQP